LPEGIATKDFTYINENYLRGLNGSSNTTPRGRFTAILEVTYGWRCIAGDAPANLNRAKQALDKTLSWLLSIFRTRANAVGGAIQPHAPWPALVVS
jgi:hypothetical protein